MAPTATGIGADVASGKAMDNLAVSATKAMGGVDILVLNHGGPPQCIASDMTEADLVRWFQPMVVSPIRIVNKRPPAKAGVASSPSVGPPCLSRD